MYALDAVPDSVVAQPQRIAVFADEGTRHALDQLGFDYDMVGTATSTERVVEDYDVFVNYSRSWGGLQQSGRDSLSAFFAAGGDYVGLRSTGIASALDAGILDAVFETSTATPSSRSTTPTAARPAGTGRGGRIRLHAGLVHRPRARRGRRGHHGRRRLPRSGYWPGWETSGAAGRPIVVSGDYGDTDVTLIGLDTTFRGHPENAFRLLGNGILEGLD